LQKPETVKRFTDGHNETDGFMNDVIVIKDKRIEEELVKDGFTKANLLGKDEITQLRALYETWFASTDKAGKYNFDSNADCLPDTKQKISSEIHRIIKSRIDALFSNYEFLPAIFFIKKPSPGPESSVTMHQDPTLLIDETEKVHIKIWCPLHDVDEKNGALQMIKGSHLFVPPVSAVTVPSHFSKVDDLLYTAKQCVSLKAGEAVMFDNRTIHCSMPNHSDTTRVTAIVSIVVPNRQFISLFCDPLKKNAPIEVYYQDHDWFYHPLWQNSQERPKTGTRAGVLDYDPFFVNEKDFLALVKTPRALKKYKYRIIKGRKNFFSRLRWFANS
jgi:hypothetical protein